MESNASALKILFISAFALLLYPSLHAWGQDSSRIKTCPVLPAEGKNSFTIGNREPLLPSPLIKLPVKAVKPRGWLRNQLELMASGMVGHLNELSSWCKAEGSAWMSRTGEGEHGWEELPYWLKGFGDLGYLLENERIVGETRKWIEAVLSSQEEDGWFGPRSNKKNHDAWPNMIMLNVLQSFFDVTGDPRVIPFMTRYFRWEYSIPREDLLPGSWQKIRGGDNLASVYWLYNRTGEKWLLDLAKVIHGRTAPWAEGVASWHGVNICQSFREPAEYYQQAKERHLLEATEKVYSQVMDLYGQVPGGMFGADENCRPGYPDPRQAAETCSMVEFMLSFEMLLGITGNPLYADRCEEVAFNSLPAAFAPDYKGLHYLTAPNMVQLDREDKSPGLQNGGCMLTYSPWERYRCCQHNAAHGWPYFTEHLWMATPDNGLAAVLYAPCEVQAKVGKGVLVRIQEETGYPFGETVRMTLSCPEPVRFPLVLRIPRWTRNASVTLTNDRGAVPLGEEGTLKPSSFTRIERTWQDGDQITLVLPMEISVRVWKRNKNSVSVDRGPFTYSLKMGERWERSGGTDAWPEWEVFPTSPWNYGLVIDGSNPAACFEVRKRNGSLPDQPFTPENSPLEILAKGRRIPGWKMHAGLVGLLQQSPVRSSEPIEEITLIPMGCARLRISAFPVIGEGPDATEWK